MDDELEVQEADTPEMAEDPRQGAAEAQRRGRSGFYAADEVPDELRPVYDEMDRAVNRKFEEIAHQRKENQTLIDAGSLLMRAQSDPTARNLLLAQLGVNGGAQGHAAQDEDDTPSYRRDLNPEDWPDETVSVLERIADERAMRAARRVAQEYEQRFAPVSSYVETQQRQQVNQKIEGLTKKFGKDLVGRHSTAMLKLMEQGIDMEAAFRAVAHEDIERHQAAQAARERHALQRRDQEATLTTDDRVSPQVRRAKTRRGALTDMVRDAFRERGLPT